MSAYPYHPLPFYLITILASLLLVPIAKYLSYRGQAGKLQPLLLLELCLPCLTALALIFFSGNQELIEDFRTRLLLFSIQPGYLAVILLLMPCIILLSTSISLFFGCPSDQFSLAKEFSVMKGWGILGIFLPLLLAPLIEELGWRGYGVDSLSAYFNLFTTSLIFGVLWALWHLPLFFIKGFYQNQLWEKGFVYVINFFASVIVGAFLMNWVFYKTGRSIPALILFHSVMNLSAILLRTQPITKCISTVLMCGVLIIIVTQDQRFFFGHSM